MDRYPQHAYCVVRHQYDEDDEDEEDWANLSDWQLRGAQPPPAYEHPPEYSHQQDNPQRLVKRGRRENRRAVQAADRTQPDGPPEYDANERTHYDCDDGEHFASEMSFSNLFSFSVPSSRTPAPFSTFREGAKERPCPGQPGDVIAISRVRYEHIVVNVGGDFVVHKCNGEGLILCQRFWNVAGEDEAYVKNSYDHCWSPFAPKEIVQRAYSKVQRKEGYNTVFANCEHFANWCRYGKQRSGQVDAAVCTIARSAAGNGKEMAGTGAESGLAVGTALGMAAGGVVGSVLGKVREMITDEPDEPCQVTRIERSTDRSGLVRTSVQQIDRKSFTQSGQVVGGLLGGALGFLGGVVGGGLFGLVSGIGQGTSTVAHRHGVQLSQFSAQLSSPAQQEPEMDNIEYD